jgi:hypothetical protein
MYPREIRLSMSNVCLVTQFLQRQRALALWREIVRSTANIPEEGARKDMRQFARTEFEQHRSVTDLVSISSPSTRRNRSLFMRRATYDTSSRYASRTSHCALRC